MKLGLISMIRNEIDIIKPFLRHIDALFDIVYLLDHQSRDGTTEVLIQAVSQRPNWFYYFLDFKGKFQKLVSNYFLKEAFSQNIDTLFFLDADEFLFIPNKNVLEENLSSLLGENKVGRLNWINCAPKNFDESFFNERTKIMISQHYSNFSKVVLPKKCFISDKNLYMTSGNHSVISSNHEELPMVVIGDLLHIPIRSKSQALKKAIISSIAKLAISNTPIGESYQLEEFLKAIAKDELNDKTLKKFIQIYESPEYRDSSDNEVERYWHDAQLTSLEKLKIAYSPELNLEIHNKDGDLHKMIADAMLSLKSLDPNDYAIKIIDNTVTVIEKNNKKDVGKANKLYNNHDPSNALRNEKQKLELDLQQIKAENKNNERLIKTMSLKIKELENKIEQLTRDLFEKEQEILFYSQSKSWRITRPLRKLMKLIK